MGERAQTLGRSFQRANDEFIAFVRQLSDEDWRSFCASEGRTVGVVVYHIAEAHALTATVVEAVAKGEPLPSGLVRNKDEADLKNARQAAEHAGCARDGTVELVRWNGAAASALVRGLTDEELHRTRFVWGREATVEQLIEHVLIGHLRSHLAAIRATADTDLCGGCPTRNDPGGRASAHRTCGQYGSHPLAE